ncbi:Hypothetical predicted protein [Drosophila guanche]|uniref:Uncharacterized protein n=1 Tax=Drosophila guanche TaxID=7266 RepID=A0A3B0JW69_DROGU|nr:Hypothetical predicted protein [Drosophila guanche]
MCRLGSTLWPRGGSHRLWAPAVGSCVASNCGTCALCDEGGVSTRPSDKWYDNCYKLWWHLAAWLLWQRRLWMGRELLRGRGEVASTRLGASFAVVVSAVAVAVAVAVTATDGACLLLASI